MKLYKTYHIYVIAAVLLACSGIAGAQISDITNYAALTLTCTNANTTCDTAGTTNFGINSSFSVLGPQTIEVNTQGYGLAQITASGTYSGSTLNFEFSDDGGTTWFPEICSRTDANIQETSEAVTANAFRGWECSVGAATKFRVRQSAITSGGPIVRMTLTGGLIEPAPTVSFTNTPGASDPCMNPGVLKSATKFAIGSATTLQITSATAGQITYVCGFLADIAGSATTAGTIQFEYGTQATTPCDTAAVTITGAMIGSLTAGVPFLVNTGSTGTQFSTIAGNQLCVVTTGTTVSIQGYITFVKQ